MELLFNRKVLNHDTGIGHPESMHRLQSYIVLEDVDLKKDLELLYRVHPVSYVNKVRQFSENSIPIDGDTILSRGSFEAAVTAVHATVAASESGDMALCRPPGHHAYASRGSGFCLFNNVAIASQLKLDMGQKVAIIDFDGHFGDGTSDIFYKTDQVLYISIHQSPAFPFLGSIKNIGSGIGMGYNVNFEIPGGSSDDIFIDAIETLLPIIEQFNPDFIGISAGFDGHWDDPVLNLNYSVNSFNYLGSRLINLGIEMFATLEGGYSLEYLPLCIDAFLSGVNGVKIESKSSNTESDDYVKSLYIKNKQLLLSVLSCYWKASKLDSNFL